MASSLGTDMSSRTESWVEDTIASTTSPSGLSLDPDHAHSIQRSGHQMSIHSDHSPSMDATVGSTGIMTAYSQIDGVRLPESYRYGIRQALDRLNEDAAIRYGKIGMKALRADRLERSAKLGPGCYQIQRWPLPRKFVDKKTLTDIALAHEGERIMRKQWNPPKFNSHFKSPIVEDTVDEEVVDEEEVLLSKVDDSTLKVLSYANPLERDNRAVVIKEVRPTRFGHWKCIVPDRSRPEGLDHPSKHNVGQWSKTERYKNNGMRFLATKGPFWLTEDVPMVMTPRTPPPAVPDRASGVSKGYDTMRVPSAASGPSIGKSSPSGSSPIPSLKFKSVQSIPEKFVVTVPMGRTYPKKTFNPEFMKAHSSVVRHVGKPMKAYPYKPVDPIQEMILTHVIGDGWKKGKKTRLPRQKKCAV